MEGASQSVLVLDKQQTRDALEWGRLITALREGFQAGCEMPLRHHHDFDIPDEASGTLLLMPAWIPGKYQGVKVANVVPGNAARGLPAVSASYLLSCARTGALLAFIDGAELTNRRTAAASALAAGYLAREDAVSLLMVGTGSLAINLIQAHAAVRPIKRVSVWGRRIEKAESVATQARTLGFDAQAVSDLEMATKKADIISCATVTTDALVRGEWLAPGSHLDLVGAFKPTMRESDDTAIQRSQVFVDTRAGATKEAGDIVQPLATGVITLDDIRADLYDLARAIHPGRRTNSEITMFKSVGAALEDLTAAILAYETITRP
ncbi:MAG: ornithine cyclodeaminase/alanine dehydrogenase-like protein (mu-crystallin family) [Congregibacter sp.]